MKKRTIILIHFSVFLILSILWIFSAEFVLRTVAPELNYVEIWLKLVKAGIILIFTLTLILVLIVLFKKRKI
jgi:hypothetical protein